MWSELAAIAAAAFAVGIPFFFFGTPSGHDVEFHLYSWLEVLGQWKHGILYPRWADLAHFGYGEPRFIFYPPASWMLGATLCAIVPWTLAATVYIWVVLMAAGASMFVLARRWLAPRDALFAALLYELNPYHLVIVYWRSAFAEMLAACLVPLLLLLVLKAAEDNQPTMFPLGMVLAAAWLTNAPAAVMIHYSLALLILFFAVREWSARLLLVGAGAVAIGAGLASFYLLPADVRAEVRSTLRRRSQRGRARRTISCLYTLLTRIMTLLTASSPGWRCSRWGSRFWAILTARIWRRMDTRVWNALLLWGVCCGVLLFPVSLVLWKILPKLQFMQFPWRWLLCLSVIFTIFVALGLRRWWARALVCIASILVIVGAWVHVRAPWWDNRPTYARCRTIWKRA